MVYYGRAVLAEHQNRYFDLEIYSVCNERACFKSEDASFLQLL